MAADHYIRDVKGFKHSFKLAGETSVKNKKIVLIGVELDYSATGFGYIQKGELIDDNLSVFNVSSFKEKPNYQTASKYVKSGQYLWNCGYFVGSIAVFEREMEQYSKKLFINYQTLKNNHNESYLNFENISIDYALIEKVKGLLIVLA